jgi:Protein of unknown function (DUF4089)
MSDPLDQMVEAGCALLGIAPEPSWLPSIRQNLEVSLRLARLVDDFPLADEAEPAPVFRA